MTANRPNDPSQVDQSAADILQPIEFEPATQPSPSTIPAIARWWKWALVALPVAAILLYLLNLKVIVFQADPTTSKATVEGVLSTAINKRLLLMPGEQKVTFSADGYHSKTLTLTTSKRDSNPVSVSLQPLPGHLTVNTNAEGRVYVDEHLKGLTHTKLEHIEAGPHQIRIEAQRYRTQTVDIVIEGKERHQNLDVDLLPNWVDTNITSEPSGATVSIDDTPVGETPISVSLDAGKRILKLEKTGYDTWQHIVRVDPDQSVTLDTVRLTPTAGKIRLDSKPTGANVLLEGKFIGTTPLTVPLSRSTSQQAVLMLQGYQPLTLTLKATQPELNVSLKPELASVTLRANPADALLYVDGRLMGRAAQTLTLPTRTHQLTVSKEGYASQTLSFTPRPGLDQLVSVTLLTNEQQRWKTIASTVESPAGQTLKLFKPNDTFTMGASRREQGRRANESLHTVTLSRPFYLGEKLVTNAEFRRFEKFHSSGHVKGNSLNSDNQPVVNVSWLNAARYCNWLSQQEKLTPVYVIDDQQVTAIDHQADGYRLPTEAEWAWAARVRGGQMLRFSWGDQLPPPANTSNLGDRSAAALLGNVLINYDDGFAVTAPAEKFAANHHGLRDIAGNAAEWIQDYYGINTGLSLKTEANPKGPDTGDYHVIRGSSWAHSTLTDLRLSYRDYGVDGRYDVGFRVARTVKVETP